ncbi:hypothetical protein LX36DRAFT_24402 [Colletotrichum falcatum]|nr:hypothetical protein LX36DRAFT_24402 [Colletotrichum falcatum]
MAHHKLSCLACSFKPGSVQRGWQRPLLFVVTSVLMRQCSAVEPNIRRNPPPYPHPGSGDQLLSKGRDQSLPVYSNNCVLLGFLKTKQSRNELTERKEK